MGAKVKFTKVIKESSLPAPSDSEDQAGSLYFVTETGNIYLDGYNVRHKMTPEYDLTLEDNNLKFTEAKGKQTRTSYISLAGTGGTNYVMGGNLGVEGDAVYIKKDIDAGLTDLNENDRTVMVNSEYLPLTSSNSTTGTVIVGGNGTQPNLSEGTNATVVGANTSFSATNNTVVGTQASATGDNASAIGAQSEATGVNSVALGYGSTAKGDNVVSVGKISYSSDKSDTVLRTITGVRPINMPSENDNENERDPSLFDVATRYDILDGKVIGAIGGDGLKTIERNVVYPPDDSVNPTDQDMPITQYQLSVDYDNSTIGINSDDQLAVIKDYANKSHTHTKDEITDLPTIDEAMITEIKEDVKANSEAITDLQDDVDDLQDYKAIIRSNSDKINAMSSKTSGSLSSIYSNEFPFYSKTFNNTGATQSITSSSESKVFNVLKEYFAHDTSTLMALVYWETGVQQGVACDWLLPITEMKSAASATLKYLLPGYYNGVYQPWLMYIIVDISYDGTNYTVKSKGMLLNTSDGSMNGNTYLSGFAVK